MQTLALENYGTSELSFDEQRETDGGELQSQISDANCAKVGNFFGGLWNGFYDAIVHCNC
jgi:hypothetical protein